MTTQTLSDNQFDKTTIAELHASSIDQLTTDDLVRLIRAAELPLRQAAEFQHRLPYYDRATLSRSRISPGGVATINYLDPSPDESATHAAGEEAERRTPPGLQ